MSTFKDQRILAFKLLIIQFVGLVLVLAIGTFSMGFCETDHKHDTDRWPLALAFILTTVATGFFFFVYKIFQLTIRKSPPPNEDESQTKFNPNNFLKAIVWIDLLAMLSLVSFTGGLSESFYTPILVIIPVIGFLIQEEPDYMFTITSFIVSFIFILLAALVNWTGLAAELSSRLLINPATKHSTFNVCVFAATLLGAGLPFIDVLIRYYHAKEGEQPNDSSQSKESD